MKNFIIENLVELKNGVNSGKIPQKIEMQITKSYSDNDFYTRSQKFKMIKNHLESSIKGIQVSISGGGIKQPTANAKVKEYNPITITTFKLNDKNNYSKIEVGGYLLNEDAYISVIYDEYIEQLITAKNITYGCLSTMELCIIDLLDETCLCESGFVASDNQLLLFKDDKVYTIIENITSDVQGVVKLYLPNEINESLIIMCYDHNILLSDDYFYIDGKLVA